MRTYGLYLTAGAAVLAALAAIAAERGLRAGAVAWVVCLVPLVRWPHRWVADDVAGPRIAGKWGLLQVGRMLFRLTWVLAVGAVLYQNFSDRLGLGFWVALIVDYQVMLALSVAGAFRDAAHGPQAAPEGVQAPNDTGGRL